MWTIQYWIVVLLSRFPEEKKRELTATPCQISFLQHYRISLIRAILYLTYISQFLFRMMNAAEAEELRFWRNELYKNNAGHPGPINPWAGSEFDVDVRCSGNGTFKPQFCWEEYSSSSFSSANTSPSPIATKHVKNPSRPYYYAAALFQFKQILAKCLCVHQI